jgi:lipoate-protein ligase A
MAFDEALMARAHDEDVAIVRVYSWSAPSISFGRNETIRGRFDERRLAASGHQLVRRPTGGRALLHVHEVTYAIALPLPANIGWRSAYDAVNRVLHRALHQLGVQARIVRDDEAAIVPPRGALCFASPAAGEIVVNEAKLVASAVWRDRTAFLQQGSILVDGNQDALQALSGLDAAMVGPVATLRSVGASQDFDSVANALESALSESTNVVCVQPDARLQRDAELRVTHFRDSSWLWRR